MKVSRRNFLKMTAGTAALASSSAGFAKAAESTVIPKRKFGRHDDMLTVLGLGGHTLYLAGSQREANAIVDRAIDLGVNFFDNAWTYHGGRAEEYMGVALQGKRDRVFLMSKFCNFRSGNYTPDAAGSMKMLEDSLRRMKTDYLDLWMMHNVIGDDAEDAYRKEGSIEAMEQAKKQGKIRYAGFTGHTTPQIHRDMIEGGYEWDATLMPVSVVGALSSRAFEKEVMPLCEEKNIAVLGMKGFGGSRRTHLHYKTNVEEVLRYALSYDQVCTHLVGIDKLEYVDMAVAGTGSKPMVSGDRARYAVNDAPDSPDYAAMQHGAEHYEEGCTYRAKKGHA
ncbi:MAG: aldo/keto reductase [Verrucomicrobiota bacterium]